MKLFLLVVYFAVLVGIGLYCRKHATDVNGFVLGGRSVGPWLTAFAYGLCRTVWLEVWGFRHMGGHWERGDRLPAGLGSAWAQDEDYDAAFGFRDDASVFWGALWE